MVNTAHPTHSACLHTNVQMYVVYYSMNYGYMMTATIAVIKINIFCNMRKNKITMQFMCMCCARVLIGTNMYLLFFGAIDCQHSRDALNTLDPYIGIVHWHDVGIASPQPTTYGNLTLQSQGARD